MRIGVEAWGIYHGSEAALGAPESTTAEVVETGCETTSWAPVAPGEVGELGDLPVAFVDGTRRMDARLFVSENGAAPLPGIAGSVGVGAVLCEPAPGGGGERRIGRWWTGRRAEIARLDVHRYLVMGLGRTLELTAGPGLEYEALSHPDTDEGSLVDTVHDRMRALEAALAQELAGGEDTLVFVDGPLALMRPGALRVVGFIKAHHRRYLDPGHEATLAALGCGERTPLFAFGEPRPRYSWYLRLCEVEDHHHSWHGVVRCETPAALGLEAAKSLADASAAILPAFASAPHWDPRAPQNLVPVAGLEKRMRH